MSTTLTYPVARRDEEVEDDYHGTLIKDPYRWMEDASSNETKSYIRELNKVSSQYLENYPMRNQIRERINFLENYAKVGIYSKEGQNYFYKRNNGLENQSVLYKTDDWKRPGVAFLDPNAMSKDGTIANTLLSFSRDGSILAYGLSEKGSDIINVEFKLVETGEVLSDTLKNLLYTSIAWEPNGKGVFYTMYPGDRDQPVESFANKGEFHSVYYHVLGTPQCEDLKCFYEPNDLDALIDVETSEDGKFIICTVTKGCDSKNKVFYGHFSQCRGNPGNVRIKPLFNELDGKYEFSGAHEGKLMFVTNLHAPKGRLILVNTAKQKKENVEVLIEEGETMVLKWARIVNRKYLFACYLHVTRHVIQVYSIKNMVFLSYLMLPQCTVVGFSGKYFDNEVFVKYTSFLNPGAINLYDVDRPQFFLHPEKVQLSEASELGTSDLRITEHKCISNDGVEIPLTVIESTKSTNRSKTAPAILYGYGGFGISILPNFSTFRVGFVKGFNGVFAVANIRGGGEFGTKWHDDGRLSKKQNVFNDFIAAAQYLCAQGYTNPGKLAIMGGSNGGLLVAACANQQPKQFQCVISQVGVFDMLRFHKFTIGQAWITEYGDPENSDDFANLIKYSPLHNVRSPHRGQQIPATLILTGDNDDRVVPCHSLKYIAQLYHCIKGCTRQKNPILAKVDTKTGHCVGKPLKKHVEESVDILCFIGRVMNLKWNF